MVRLNKPRKQSQTKPKMVRRRTTTIEFRPLTIPIPLPPGLRTGRPPIFKTAADMRKAIVEYFESCWITKLRKTTDLRTNQEVVEEYRVQTIPYTICGLSSHLGMHSRSTLLDYQYNKKSKDPDF